MEMFVILVIAGIVMGPARIAQTARWLGQTTAKLQGISRAFTEQIKSELDAVDETGDLKEALKEVRDLQRQVSELRHEITTTATGALKEGQGAIRQGQDAVRESQQALSNVIRPPSLPAMEPAAESEGDRAGMNVGNETESEKAGWRNGNGTKAVQQPIAPPKLPKLVEVPDDPE